MGGRVQISFPSFLNFLLLISVTQMTELISQNVDINI